MTLLGRHWSDFGVGPFIEDPVVAFTGHRPDKLGGYRWSHIQEFVCRALRWRLIRLRPALCISGMALGVDQWAASICCELGLPWDAYVPFLGQESAWPADSQREYSRLLKLARRVQVCSPGEYSAKKMQWRNMAMVNECDVLLAVWDGSDGGTANCVRYALNSPPYSSGDPWARCRVIRYNPRPLTGA
jgi:uncharacterized phage-like protein YoqJ